MNFIKFKEVLDKLPLHNAFDIELNIIVDNKIYKGIEDIEVISKYNEHRNEFDEKVVIKISEWNIKSYRKDQK